MKLRFAILYLTICVIPQRRKYYLHHWCWNTHVYTIMDGKFKHGPGHHWSNPISYHLSFSTFLYVTQNDIIRHWISTRNHWFHCFVLPVTPWNTNAYLWYSCGSAAWRQGEKLKFLSTMIQTLKMDYMDYGPYKSQISFLALLWIHCTQRHLTKA